MGDMVTARDCCLKTIRFWSVCESTPCPCTSVNPTLEEDQVLPVYWSGIPCDSRMEVAARVDDVTHETEYSARIFNDADGDKTYTYTVDNNDGAGPDQYPWQVAEALAAVINANSGDFDTPITATAYRDGFVKLSAGDVPIRATLRKNSNLMTDHATRWPTPDVSGPCVILGGTGSYSLSSGSGPSRVSNFSGFSCWDSIASLPPCLDNEFRSAIAGKAVLVVDSKVYVWRAKVSHRAVGTNYSIHRTRQIGVLPPSHDDVVYIATNTDALGTIDQLAQNIANAINAAWGGEGYVASAPGQGWVEIHHSTGHRRFGNDSTRYFKIVHDGYTDDMDTWTVSNVVYYGLEMTGWDLIPVTGQQNARLMDAGLGEELFDYDIITGTDEAKAADYATSFNTWAAGTPAFKGFRDVTATRVYWGVQHTGTVPTASGDPAALYLDAAAPGTDDALNDCRVVIDSGTGAGQIQTITDYTVVGPTRLAAVSPGWTINPDTDSVVRIYRHVGVKFESANPAHPADPRGHIPPANHISYWARNGNPTTGDTQRTNAWTDIGVVRKCCGPLHGSTYAVRFAGEVYSGAINDFVTYDVTASIAVDNPNTTGDCKGDGPDDTPAEIADKWVAAFNAIAGSIPDEARPTATHIGSGVIVLEGPVYYAENPPPLPPDTTQEYETAGPFNFHADQPDSAWLGFSVIQNPVNGAEETDTVWYWDGKLAEIPYRPFVGWSYQGSTTEWHAANIAEATIVGAEYADGMDCTDEPPPAAGCPGKCHNDCLSLDATVTISGSVTWREQTEADPCTVSVVRTMSFNTGAQPVFSGCTSIGGGADGVTWSAMCPTFGSFQVRSAGPPELFAWFYYENGEWLCGWLNGSTWEPFPNLCHGGPEITGSATVTFEGGSEWHLGDDPDCDETYEKCLPGPAPDDEGGGMPEPTLPAAAPPVAKTKAPKGLAGTVLTAMLRRLGYKATPGCGCKAHAKTMGAKGTDWCEQNLDTIVGWLREEAAAQNKTFIEPAARLLVKQAIATARNREARRLQKRKDS